MTTEPTAQPATRWPFQPGEAVYYVPSDYSWIRPMPIIPAIVLTCEHFANPLRNRRARATIQRDDKARPSSVRACNLVYRGYCSACEVPAIVGPNDTLICPRCHEDAVPLPPTDRLVVRWYPLDEWLDAMVMRRQIEHPTWPWRQAREAMDEVIDGGYTAMLERLGLGRLYSSSYNVSDLVDTQQEHRLFGLLRVYAVLEDAGAFLSTYQDLITFQVDVSRKLAIARRLQQLNGDQIDRVLDEVRDLADEPTQPSRPVYLDLPEPPERTAEDSEPDGADDTTAWLERQFRRAA
jgi:hypothetical protein